MASMTQRNNELPDYLEIGNDEVYEDPGSTLPQDLVFNIPTSPSQSSVAARPRIQIPPNAHLPVSNASESPGEHADSTVASSGSITLRPSIASQTAQPAPPQAILASPARSGSRPDDKSMPKRVLVVDDDLTARLYLRSRLMLRGNVALFEASEPLEALNILEKLQQVDAALLDVDMGNMNGYELCKAIRAWARDQRFKQPAIFMITSRTSMIDKMRAKMAGADAFLSKPPKPAELAALLARL